MLHQASNVGERGAIFPFGGIEFIRKSGQRELPLKKIKLFGWNWDAEWLDGCHVHAELCSCFRERLLRLERWTVSNTAALQPQGRWSISLNSLKLTRRISAHATKTSEGLSNRWHSRKILLWSTCAPASRRVETLSLNWTYFRRRSSENQSVLTILGCDIPTPFSIPWHPHTLLRLYEYSPSQIGESKGVSPQPWSNFLQFAVWSNTACFAPLFRSPFLSPDLIWFKSHVPDQTLSKWRCEWKRKRPDQNRDNVRPHQKNSEQNQKSDEGRNKKRHERENRRRCYTGKKS